MILGNIYLLIIFNCFNKEFLKKIILKMPKPKQKLSDFNLKQYVKIGNRNLISN